MNRIDVSSTVKKAQFFFIVDGGLFLEIFFLTQATIRFPYQWLLAIPLFLAALMNILFLSVFENTLRKARSIREADTVSRCGTIAEKVALLDLWLQLGRLRLGVFLATILVNLLSVAYLYHCLTL